MQTIEEGGVWRIRRSERSPAIEVFKHEETGYGDILPPEFVQWRLRGNQDDAGKVETTKASVSRSVDEIESPIK